MTKPRYPRPVIIRHGEKNKSRWGPGIDVQMRLCGFRGDYPLVVDMGCIYSTTEMRRMAEWLNRAADWKDARNGQTES